jgi:hypothetical protein
MQLRNNLEKLQSYREHQHPNNSMERTVESLLVYRLVRSAAAQLGRWAASHLGEGSTSISRLGKRGFKIKQVYLYGVINREAQ